MFKAILSNNLALENLVTHWNIYLPSSLGYGHLSISQQEEITGKINMFYFGSEATPKIDVDRNNLVNVRKRYITMEIFLQTGCVIVIFGWIIHWTGGNN